METIKKPEMLLGVGNTVAIVGLGVYFYKQLAAIKMDLEELTEHLKTSVKKFSDIQKETVPRDEMVNVLNALNQKVETTQKGLEKVGVSDDIELLEEALESLSDALNEAGVEWDFPPRRRGRRGKKKRRKTKPKLRDYSESESDEASEEDSDSDVDRSIAKVRGKRKSKRKS